MPPAHPTSGPPIRIDLAWGRIDIALSPDEMQAALVRLEPAGGLPPGPEALEEALAAAGLPTGLDTAALAEILRDSIESWRGQRLLGSGTPPTVGRDARLEWAVDLSKRPGTARGDGSIDLRERHLVHNVSEGQLLVRKFPATAGQSGRTLGGKEIAAAQGKDLGITAGENVVFDEAAGEFRAATAGVASWDGAVLSVAPLFRLDGDIDYATGDLSVDCAVYIGGTVRSGFTVAARGDAIVAGSVEDGAVLQIQGDLTVGGGIVGGKTKIGITGDLRCHFIQNASVSARGGIRVGSYIRNARVRGGAGLVVERGGGRLGGNISGGHTTAGASVELHSLGAVAEPTTLLEVAGDMASQKETARLQREQAFCDTNISKMMRTLGLQTPTPAAVRRLLPTIPPGKRPLYVKVLQQLNLLLKRRRETDSDLKRLLRDSAEHLARSKVRVSGGLFPRAQIQLGQTAYRATAQTGPGVLELAGKKVVFTPMDVA